MNDPHETLNRSNEPEPDINLHESVDDLDIIDQMITAYFTPARLDQMWQRTVESVCAYDAGQARGDDSPDSLDTGHLGVSAEKHTLLALSRDGSRAATSAVEASRSLGVASHDLRVMNHDERHETTARLGELRELLSRCPAGAFGAEDSAMVLTVVARLSESLIADRDERTAVGLIRAANSHLNPLGRRHPAVLQVRRVWASAWSELGRYSQAEKTLRRLSEDEREVFGSADPQTALLLNWVLVGQGRLREADDGFRSLEDRLTQSPGAEPEMVRHVQCRHAWLLGRLGRVNESMSDYARVIASRTNELGEDHADTLDARHSQGKILVVAGQGSQALPIIQALADDRARIQGDRHPDTLETLKYLQLARVQAESGDNRIVERTINDLVEILRIQDERHGPEHPMGRDTTAWLHKLFHRSIDASRNTRSTLEQLTR